MGARRRELPTNDPMIQDLGGYRGLSYEAFRRRARDPELSPYEKIGFPDSYRSGREEAIFADIRRKLHHLEDTGKLVVDIGPGCSGLPRMIIDLCRRRGHTIVLVDSPEMLALLPDGDGVVKVPGRFPDECAALIDRKQAKVDVVLVYSVFHYVFAESNPFDFLDRCLELLRPGGELLIGDIPSRSKRQRFFSSAAGIRFHQQFMDTPELPDAVTKGSERGSIDDAVTLSLVLRARTAGFDAYVMPQPDDLPMANRREDILIRRP